jgi:hypothetical protein
MIKTKIHVQLVPGVIGSSQVSLPNQVDKMNRTFRALLFQRFLLEKTT